MKKKFVAAFLLFAVAISVCGCYARVKNREELIKYANDTYGAATFQGAKKKLKGKESYTTVYMNDNETGINYSITSSLVDEVGDGKPSSYEVKTESDFEDLYFMYITNEAVVDLDPVVTKYGFGHSCKNGIGRIDFFVDVSAATIEEALSEFDRILSGYDTRGLRPNEYLVYDNSGAYIGSYDAASGVFSAADDLDTADLDF